jgi:hypothetical protein
MGAAFALTERFCVRFESGFFRSINRVWNIRRARKKSSVHPGSSEKCTELVNAQAMAIQKAGVDGMDELGFVSNLGLTSSNLPIRGWTREMSVAVGSVQRVQRGHPFWHNSHGMRWGSAGDSFYKFFK